MSSKNDITFVLMTCGELTEKQCVKAATREAGDEADFKVVRNVYPQIKALNQMIDKVETEFFIPLDADIVLEPDSWPKIRTALNKHRRDPQWHTILFPLWDTLTERRILALKLLRSSVAKEHMFKESATPDVEHFQRLTEAGYTCIDRYLKLAPIGKHIVKGKHFCYHKYRDVYQTYKSHGWEWDSGAFLGGDTLPQRANAHFQYFFGKWVTTNNRDYLWCIAGMMDGILAPTEHKSKDLSNKKLQLTPKEGIHLFMDWYMKYGDEFQSARFLF